MAQETNLQRKGRETWDHPMQSFKHALGELLDDWFGEERRLPKLHLLDGKHHFFSPRVDVTDEAANFVVTAELPGIAERDLDVSLDQNVLVIKGEKRESKDEKKKNYERHERYFGAFERRLPLSAPVKADQIKANFSDGVLKIILPKAPQEKRSPQKITLTKET